MPLYDFHCGACEGEFSRVVAYGVTPACPMCGHAQPAKKLSLFAFNSGTGPEVPQSGPPKATKEITQAKGAGHIHSSSCGCSSSPAQGKESGPNCATADYADALIQKHLGT